MSLARASFMRRLSPEKARGLKGREEDRRDVRRASHAPFILHPSPFILQYDSRRMEHNTAFVFPGQGSQFTGMGKDIFEAYPVGRRVFQEIDDALGFSISQVCFEGSEDQLKLTENTQPAILAVSA